ncbi:MAG: leucine-rich repeat protein [Bacteroidaceae bacterium]|nr:leucine-rich repeat protein [Bacteroidaceae bacterium]
MKKTLKLMLAFALVALGSTSAWAVKSVGSTFNDGTYGYEVTSVAGTTLEAKITGILDEQKTNVDKAGTLAIPGTFPLTDGNINYTVNVTEWDASVFQDLTAITGISIPAQIKNIPENAFKGCTNVQTITFAANSQVEEIGKYAFGSTRITTFDFSNCVKLRQLKDYVFVSGVDSKNSFITTVTVPGANNYYFKHINKAFANLTNLTAINNLDKSYVEEIVSSAFANTKLTSLSLPATTKYVAKDAFKDLKTLANLTINVRDLISLGGGTVGENYAWTPADATDNLFDANNAANTSLKTLVLTGELKGKIAKYAFYNCTALKGSADTDACLLDLKTNFSLGSTGTIEPYAFGGCTSIKALDLCDITDNENQNYTIQSNAFKGCLNLATVTVGNIAASKAIEKEAFANCVTTNAGLTTFTVGNISGSNAIDVNIALGSTRLTTVTIGNITANEAIAAKAFSVYESLDQNTNSVTTVTIGNIVNATSAMGEYAFGNNLKTVTIGTVSAAGTAIPANAFVWGNNTGSTLDLAQGTGEYLSQTAANTESPAIVKGAFNMSGITGGTPFVFPVIKIGEIRSKGGAFAAGAIKAPTTINELTFTGAIADNGLKNVDDGAFLGIGEANTYTGLTEITFKGTVGVNALPTGIFANCSAIATFNFEDVMAGAAVGAGAFYVPATVAAKIYLKYTGEFDYTKNPFDKNAFDAEADDDTDRFILLYITNGEGDEASANATLLLAEYQNAQYGLGENDETRTSDLFDIYLVKFYEAPEAGLLRTFPVYANNNALTEAWGRYDDFGKWGTDAVEAQGVIYSFTSFETGNEDNTYASGTVEVVDQDEISTTVEVLTNGTDENDDFIGNQYVVYATELTANASYELYDPETVTATGMYVTLTTEAPEATASDATNEVDGADYYFTSYPSATSNEPYATGAVEVIYEGATSTTVRVLTNSVDGFVGKVFVVNATQAQYEAGTRYQLYSAATGISVKDLAAEGDGEAIEAEDAVDNNPDWPWHSLATITIQNGVKVARYQKAYDQATYDARGTAATDVKVTLYGVYTDEDDNAPNSAAKNGKGLSTIYMVPLKVTDGYYWISKENAKTVVAKVTGNFAANTTYHINWTDVAPETEEYDNNSVWSELPEVNDFQFSTQVDTHEQLWDGQNDDVHAVQFNIWETGTKYTLVNGIAPQALFVMPNPANYHGMTIRRITFKENNEAFLGNGWYYTHLKSYGEDAEASSASAQARVVWLDDDEATAIFGVKEDAVTTTDSKFNGAIYNLQGIRVNESYKGIVIKNGKKYLQK